MFNFRDVISDFESAYKKTATVLGSESRRLEATRAILLKSANLGADQTQSFERAFGAVAYTYLQEKVPSLVQHIVGFQLIDRDDESEKASGVFVAKIGNSIVDVPMFFEKNELKGHVLMRIREPELFLPLREAFLEYVLSRMPQDLGDATEPEDRLSPVPSQPDMTMFDASHGGMGKMSNDFAWVSEWAKDYKVVEEYVKMSCNPDTLERAINVLNKKASKTICNIVDIIKEDLGMLKSACELADEFPEFDRRMAKVYGENWYSDAALAYADKLSKQAEDLVKLSSISELKLTLDEVQEGPKVVSYTEVPPFADAEETDLALNEIRKHGEYIWDNRVEHSKPDVVEITERVDISPPMTSGIFDILMANGNFERKLVVVSPKIKGGNVEPLMDLIVDMSSKEWCFVDRSNYASGHGMASRDFDSKVEWNKVLNSVSGSPSEGAVGFFLTKSGMSTGLIKLGTKHAEDLYQLDYASIYSNCYERPRSGLTYSSSGSSSCGYSRNDFEQVMLYDSTEQADIQCSGSKLLVPKNAKFVELYKDKEYSSEEAVPLVSANKPKKLAIATIANMSFSELDKVTRIKLQKISSDRFELNGRPMTCKEARHTLIMQAGLDKEAADALTEGEFGTRRFVLVKDASSDELATLVKLANAAYDAPYIPFPSFDGPQSGPTGNYNVSNNPQMQETSAPLDPTRMPLREGEDPHDYLMGGQGGLGETDGGDPDNGLWDVSGLRAIIRNARIDSDIRLVTKSLLSLIDRLGRQIFSFYAHLDEYADLYGEEELNDLESLLLSNFEGCGDLFITLSRKSAEPTAELDAATLTSDLSM